MSSVQCWSSVPTGDRCPEPALPFTHFCAFHSRHGQPHPMSVFRAPEAEMPPDLVEAIRLYAPGVTFPALAPTAGPGATEAAPPPEAPHLSPPRSLPAGPPGGPSQTPESGLIPDEVPFDPSSVSLCLRGESDADPLAWLQSMLREAMTGLMASDAPPLPKANAIARLGSLYLRACRTTEIAQENKALKRRLAELEKRLAAAEARAAAPAARADSPAELDDPSDTLVAAIPGADRPPVPRRAPAAAVSESAVSSRRPPSRPQHSVNTTQPMPPRALLPASPAPPEPARPSIASLPEPP